MNLMKIDNCEFPEDLLYDMENFVWADLKATSTITIGISTLLSAISGRLSAITLKDVGTQIQKGKRLATIESNTYFGVVRAPLSGRVLEVNESILRRPKIVNDFPYSEGWFVKMEPLSIDKDPTNLLPIGKCHDTAKALIKDLHIRCFVAYPDYEMFEIGVECAATLTKLDELIPKIKIGEIVHLVSDDKTASVEMIRWSEGSGQSILETRPEGNLMHFIVRRNK
jgi:glycine cleavage system H protein